VRWGRGVSPAFRCRAAGMRQLRRRHARATELRLAVPGCVRCGRGVDAGGTSKLVPYEVGYRMLVSGLKARNPAPQNSRQAGSLSYGEGPYPLPESGPSAGSG